MYKRFLIDISGRAKYIYSIMVKKTAAIPKKKATKTRSLKCPPAPVKRRPRAARRPMVKRYTAASKRVVPSRGQARPCGMKQGESRQGAQTTKKKLVTSTPYAAPLQPSLTVGSLKVRVYKTSESASKRRKMVTADVRELSPSREREPKTPPHKSNRVSRTVMTQVDEENDAIADSPSPRTSVNKALPPPAKSAGTLKRQPAEKRAKAEVESTEARTVRIAPCQVKTEVESEEKGMKVETAVEPVKTAIEDHTLVELWTPKKPLFAFEVPRKKEVNTKNTRKSLLRHPSDLRDFGRVRFDVKSEMLTFDETRNVSSLVNGLRHMIGTKQDDGIPRRGIWWSKPFWEEILNEQICFDSQQQAEFWRSRSERHDPEIPEDIEMEYEEEEDEDSDSDDELTQYVSSSLDPLLIPEDYGDDADLFVSDIGDMQVMCFSHEEDEEIDDLGLDKLDELHESSASDEDSIIKVNAE
eukprot:GEMP01025590.1.p1 GENE.GEMP01025590.1~~GEMP01025590.1.p1  ORF type:complete len:476 (+),score=90.65 GEMP01025590.1:22-1428(+)